MSISAALIRVLILLCFYFIRLFGIFCTDLSFTVQLMNVILHITYNQMLYSVRDLQ